MSKKAEVISWLNSHSIPYRLYEHEAAHTMEDCYALPFAGPDMTFCKNILLCNRQKTAYYFYIMPAEKSFRTAQVSKLLGVSRLSFAPSEDLMRLMSTEPGSLSPFGLLYDLNTEITFVYDQDIRNTTWIAFHPCDNTSTIVLQQNAFWSMVVPLFAHDPIQLKVVINEGDEVN